MAIASMTGKLFADEQGSGDRKHERVWWYSARRWLVALESGNTVTGTTEEACWVR